MPMILTYLTDSAPSSGPPVRAGDRVQLRSVADNVAAVMSRFGLVHSDRVIPQLEAAP